MDIAQFALLVEDLCAPFAGKADGFREDAEEFDDLRDVVVVFAVFCARLWVEEVVASYELEDLDRSDLMMLELLCGAMQRLCMYNHEGLGKSNQLLRTIAAILHTSVLAPHLEPRMTSGDRYCRVWMSFVKWWPTQQALPKSAILTEMLSIAKSSPSFSADEEGSVLVLSMFKPDTSLVKRSLLQISHRIYVTKRCYYTHAVFSL